MRTCSICPRKHTGLGYCSLHYQRYKIHGDPNKIVQRQEKHGLWGTPEWFVWNGMKKRCLNPNHPDYHNYGGRGVKVADSWFSFSQFYKDMGKKPTPTHTIDRIDNDGDYGPDNCRWATKLEQDNNKRNTRRYLGKTVRDWSSILGVNLGAIKSLATHHDLQYAVNYYQKKGFAHE